MHQSIIRPHVEMPLMKCITDVMVCAHDEDEHTIRWSEVANGWLLENKNGLVDNHVWGHLGLAVLEMERATGNNATLFTITDQP